jgi:hypothetical protein
LRSRVKVRGAAAIVAATALSGLGLIGLTPAASAAPDPAKPYDFNGDGYVDLAIGSPYGTVNKKTSAGIVSIIYGSSAGLNTGKKQVFTQDLSWVPGAAEAYDHFGFSLASGDFDQDGFADLAVGTPDEDIPAGKDAGLLTVFWGSSSGLTAASGFTDDPSFEGPSQRFSKALAVGDIEHDGSPELFITIPGTSDFTWFVWQQPAGVTAQSTNADPSRGARLNPRAGKGTGISAQSAADVTDSWLAVGDVTGDHLDDVVYAWYDADWPVAEERRGFVVLPGIADGNLDFDTVVETFTDVRALTVGDFDGDGFADIAVGQPADSSYLGGQVSVYKGAAPNIDPAVHTEFHQDTAGVPGAGEAGDSFGASLAAADITHDGKADLAVGAPLEDVGSVVDGGATFILRGSATGLTGTGSQVITQNTDKVVGGAEKGDKFGTQVTLLDNNKDDFADLSAGAPAENAGDGMISWLKGTETGVIGTNVYVTASTFNLLKHHAEIGRRLGRLG